MIQFKVFAPSRISLFGKHAVKYGKKGLMTRFTYHVDTHRIVALAFK